MIRHPPKSPLFPYPPLSRSTLLSRRVRPVPSLASQETSRAPSRRHPLTEKDSGTNPVSRHAETPHLLPALPSPSLAVAAKADRKSTRLNSSHANISYAVFCL